MSTSVVSGLGTGLVIKTGLNTYLGKVGKKVKFSKNDTNFDKGIKISKIFDKFGNFKHWYCDIIKHEYIKKEDKYIVTDLLVDVVVYPDGHYEVLDLEELDEALKENLISLEVKEEALDKLNSLLDVIKKGEFENSFGKDFKI